MFQYNCHGCRKQRRFGNKFENCEFSWDLIIPKIIEVPVKLAIYIGFSPNTLFLGKQL